jgi:hypothetical protein
VLHRWAECRLAVQDTRPGIQSHVSWCKVGAGKGLSAGDEAWIWCYRKEICFAVISDAARMDFTMASLSTLYFNYCLSGYYPPSCYSLKHAMFRRLNSVSVFRWNLLSYAQSIELVPIYAYQHQHKIRYTNQAQQKPSARVKTKVKKVHTHET